MTEEQLQQITGMVYKANSLIDAANNARQCIDCIERYDFKLMLGDSHDVSKDLPLTAFEKIRGILISEYQSIIDNSTRQLEQL